MRPLRITLLTIAFFQFVLGALFVLAPAAVATSAGSTRSPHRSSSRRCCGGTRAVAVPALG